MNRTFLFLLVVGLFIVAWQRDRGKPVPAPASKAAPVSAVKPAAPAPTNSITDRNLVSAGQTIHK